MIRAVCKKDLEKISAIYNYYIENSTATFEEEAVAASEIGRRVESVHKDNLPWLVADKGNQIAGYAYATNWKTRSAYRYSAEIAVYLDHTNQSRGWGTKLYEALFATLKNRSMHAVIAGVTLPNPASVALHEKFGMEKVAHFTQVGYKFGRWLDVGYWQKVL